MEFTLLGAALMAVIALYGMLWWEAGRANAADCTRDLWDAALTAVVVGLFAGRLWAMVTAGVNPLTSPADILVVRGGVATGPAAVAALLTYGFVTRHRLLFMLDGIAPAALAGLAGWQSGCLARDACLGSPSTLPWAWTTPGGTVSRHPVELYAAVLYALAAMALGAWKRRRRPAPGVLAATALIVAGLVRLVTEPLRPSLGAGPVWWYAAAIAVGVIAVVRAVRRKPSASSGPLAP